MLVSWVLPGKYFKYRQSKSNKLNGLVNIIFWDKNISSTFWYKNLVWFSFLESGFSFELRFQLLFAKIYLLDLFILGLFWLLDSSVFCTMNFSTCFARIYLANYNNRLYTLALFLSRGAYWLNLFERYELSPMLYDIRFLKMLNLWL